MKRVMATALVVLLTACATTTTTTPAQQDPEEMNITATVIALYNVISGPAGRRDWNVMKALFAPNARLMSVRKDGTFNVMTPDEYIERAKPYFDQNGFFERPVSNRIERFRDIVHVFSRYESRHASNDAAPFARGVNSFQLVRIGNDWKIVTILWQEE